MTPAFRILPVLVLSMLVLFGMRAVELWTGFSAVGPALASDASKKDAAKKDESHGAPPAPAAAPTTHVDAGAPLPPAVGDAHGSDKDTHIPALAEPEKAPPAAAVADIKAAPEGKPVAAPRQKIPGEEDFMTASEIEVLSSLTKRREDLDKRASELDMREKLLIATEQRLEQKLAEIKAIESKIQGVVHELDENQAKQIASLVKVYESMKPKDAANIMQDLDQNILLEVAARMKEAKMAPILAAMDPKKAREVTVLLAKRNEVPGREG